VEVDEERKLKVNLDYVTRLELIHVQLMATGEVGRRSADAVSHVVEDDMNDHVYAITLHLHMEDSIVYCLDKLTRGEKKKVKSDLATWMFALQANCYIAM
jgi:hypothetical protein